MAPRWIHASMSKLLLYLKPQDNTQQPRYHLTRAQPAVHALPNADQVALALQLQLCAPDSWSAWWPSGCQGPSLQSCFQAYTGARDCSSPRAGFFISPHRETRASSLTFPQHAQVPLGGDTTTRHISHSSQLCIIYQLDEGVHCPTIKVINEDVNWCWPQYRPLRCCTSDLSSGLVAGHLPLITTAQAQPFSVHLNVHLSNPYFLGWFISGSAESLTESKLSRIHCPHPPNLSPLYRKPSDFRSMISSS